jgi:CDGSH-type Zn-finger protein
VKITVRDNGPLLVDVKGLSVCDTSGGEFFLKGSNVALCRCGASLNKPFCDGAHVKIAFQAANKAGLAS